ncbi:hypothetical protein HYX18_02165 [Candidatus Woesearchaeota archaeon]|nr:hypothetical protein [Candidatus Woesearchaeota archaeon]
MARKKTKKRLYLLLLIVFLVGTILGLSVDYKLRPENYQTIVNENVDVIKYEPTNLYNKNVGIAQIKIPAVDNNGNGVATNLIVEATPGTGKTLVDIDSLLFIADTQNSIRVAKEVAAKFTGLDLNKYDLVYHLDANASVIGGPSAGAAVTIATIAALNKQELKDNVMITGGINHDATISPVGGIVDKAIASKKVGADLFLVPLDQKEEVVYENKEYCRKIGLTEFCTVEQIPKRVSVEQEANINVIEVGNITEAYQYFVK